MLGESVKQYAYTRFIKEIQDAVSRLSRSEPHFSELTFDLRSPFFGFGSKPDDEQFFDGGAQRKSLRDQNHAWTGLPLDEAPKMIRQGPQVM